MSPQNRGQTLVLAALTLLLVTLMVVFTLSLGWRVRDRVETQMVADTAAYSQAVDVARTFNEVALMNRTMIAMQVSALAMSALISWSSHYRSNLAATEVAMGIITAQYVAQCCGIFCPCQCAEAARSAFSLAAVQRESARVRGIWSGLETDAAAQLRAQWLGSVALFHHSRDLLVDRLIEDRVEDQRLAATLAGLASPELSAPPRGADKTALELNAAINDGDPDVDVIQSVIVTMGTRGDDFVTARTGGRQPIFDKLQPPVQAGNGSASVDVAAYDGRGGTGIGNQAHHNAVRTVQVSMPWAEDHGGMLTVSWPSACGTAASAPVRDAQLASGYGGAVHRYTPGDGVPATHRHSFGASESGKAYPNMLLYAFRKMDNPEDDFGQPKVYSIIDRDYRRVGAKPWDLRFRFASGSIDLNSPSGAFTSPSGADLQHQTALGSAIVYYHRPGAWREPPNLFNPFWRATLYASDDDVRRHLRSAGFVQHGDAVQRLLDRGWVGTR
ncbi:MAG: hypothetical protein JNK82_05715 [Myxococcaceae bacterium]|nr:hypothetical protein [Myxococcaceae bacterium]